MTDVLSRRPGQHRTVRAWLTDGSDSIGKKTRGLRTTGWVTTSSSAVAATTAVAAPTTDNMFTRRLATGWATGTDPYPIAICSRLFEGTRTTF